MPQSNIVNILSTLQQSDSNTTAFNESWAQGRSAFGGLSAALAVTAMKKLLENDLPMQSLMVSFIAPLPAGEVNVEPVIQRQGKNVTQMAASVFSDGKLCLQAMAAFGNPREGIALEHEYKFNPVARENGIPIANHVKRLPPFLSYFDGCWISGGMPFSGQGARKLNMWVKHKADMGSFATENIVTLADIPPPVILSYFDTPPVPASSLTWSLEFLVPAESVNSEWFFLEFYIEAAANGYTQQSGLVFDENGRLCAITRQCMVYFG